MSRYICKNIDKMNLFTISQLQRYSGINIHSIRAWENRYGGLTPKRSDGNTRYYDSNQLRRLLNISSLTHGEYKISELCSMTDDRLFELIEEQLQAQNVRNDYYVSQIVSATVDYNESHFNKIFEKAVAELTLEGAYNEVIYPFLNRIGLMWTSNNITPSQEHFGTQLIRQKLSKAIDELPVNEHAGDHWILFLEEGEFHEIGLMMAHYLLRKSGIRCTYLGANIPMDTLIHAVNQLKPQALLYFLVTKNNDEADLTYLNDLQLNFPTQKIISAGRTNSFKDIKPRRNLKYIDSLHALKELIH